MDRPHYNGVCTTPQNYKDIHYRILIFSARIRTFTQNILARVAAGNLTPCSNLATLSQLYWLPVHDRIKLKTPTLTYKAVHIPVTPHILLVWSSNTLRAELYSLPLPTFSLLLAVTSGARGFRSAAPAIWNSLPNVRSCKTLTTFRRHLKSHYFPFSLCHCPATHLGASDSFTTMALYIITYLLTY